MTVTDVFEADQPKPEEAAATAEQPQTASADAILAKITNADGKQKYSSVEDALYGLHNAQEHIHRIETENKQLREENALSSKVDELFAKLDEPKGEQTAPSAGVSIEDIRGVAFSAIKEHEQKSTAEKNIRAVDEALSEKFGEHAKEKVAHKAKDLGVDVTFLKDMASRSPEGFMKLFSEGEGKGTHTLTGSVNTEALTETKPTDEVTAPADIMFGAPASEVLDVFRKVKEKVNADLGL